MAPTLRGSGRVVPIAAVVLAAGSSTRFGGYGPKALAPIGGETAVRRIARVCGENGCDPIVVVAGTDSVRIAEGVQGTSARTVPNPAWYRGRTGSIQAGLASVPGSRAALIWPVDAPFVASATVRNLLDRVEIGGLATWWTPTFQGRGGHPIVIASESFEAVLRLPPEYPLRSAPFRGGMGEVRVPLDDPGILDNTNTPTEFFVAEAAWRARGSA